jgi:hypothetical protein
LENSGTKSVDPFPCPQDECAEIRRYHLCHSMIGVERFLTEAVIAGRPPPAWCPMVNDGTKLPGGMRPSHASP